MEKWAKILNAKGEYYVSNLGNVKRIKKGRERYIGNLDKNGYKRVTLIDVFTNKIITKKVHRLVAMYFLDNYDETLTVNHKDFNKSNNNVSNLEMISVEDNCLHYIKNVKKENSYSKKIGVSFHKQLNKWTTRIKINGKRLSIGTYKTEYEAVSAIEEYYKGNKTPIVGKGASNIGKCKYDDNFKIKCIIIANYYGIRKAGVICGLTSTNSTTYISKWRKSEYFIRFYDKKILKKGSKIPKNMEDAYEIALNEFNIKNKP